MKAIHYGRLLLIRIFILRDIVKKYELEDIVHFDNDVLIYMKAEELYESFLKIRSI